MKRDATDFSRVDPRHDAIHIRLEQWGRWVVDVPKAWRVHPMFRQYRSHAWQWHMPEIQVRGSSLDHLETEKIVCTLPDKHREAIRWAYVWPWVPVSAVRRELAVTKEGLQSLIIDGRDMVINRLRRA